jgi:UDP-glucuronate 4-epimerase
MESTNEMNRVPHPTSRVPDSKKILVTGAAGFIGFHLCRRLLERGDQLTGLDNLSDYYDVSLKESRLKLLDKYENYSFEKCDIADRCETDKIFAGQQFDVVVNLAAQAGVRYSLTNPRAYIDANVVGFMNILEGCRQQQIGHLVYASSSSVYGANTRMPFSVHDNIDHPVSLYAASKKADELMAHTYAHLYGIPSTGLRFFTVYGPWGRPDMALFLFTRAILAGEPINVFNHGRMRRDFTYIDDIVEGVVRVLDRPAQSNPDWSGDQPDPGTSLAPYRVYNIGNNSPVELMHLIGTLEQALGKVAIKNFMPIQPGDVPATWANVDDLSADVGFRPETPIEVGVQNFVDWYLEYYV